MDKYTIDLDQLLDDFEYSELTDQHSNRDKIPSAEPSRSYEPHAVVKHSINNVFHSLNEYLNTNVNSGENVTSDNNIGDKVENNNCTESVNQENGDCIKKTDENVELNEKSNSLEELNVCTDSNGLNCDINVVRTSEEDNCLERGEQSVESTENDVKVDEIIDINVDKDSGDVGQTESEEVAFIENKVNEDNQEVEVENEIIQNNEEKCEKEEVECQEVDNVVGFVDDIEVDEAELTKMLEELEENEEEKIEEIKEELTPEVDPKQVDVESTRQEATDEANPEQPQNEAAKENVEAEAKEKEVAQRPQDLPLKTDSSEEPARKIDLIGSPGSTPYNNVYVSKTFPKKQNDSDSEYYSSASPTFSDASTESTSTASTASVEDTNSEKKPTEVATEDDIQEVPENAETASRSVQSPSDTQPSNPTLTTSFLDKSWLGKEAPLWIPDSDSNSCLHCDMKFTMIKRRHHCRACGLVLCAKCCNLKFRLEYLDAEARVCQRCYDVLSKNEPEANVNTSDATVEMENPLLFRPNPNNPLEYCSTVSPLQQVDQSGISTPPAVMVPVGVLKRKGSNKSKGNKSVMFCDGIAPGSDLTNLDKDFNYSTDKKAPKTAPEEAKKEEKVSRNQPKVDTQTKCFIPSSESSLPPTVTINKTDFSYSDCSNCLSVVEMLKNEVLIFAINSNLFVHVKIINMSCCINKQAWCFSTEGLINVGNDEIVILLELIEDESYVPKDIFFHIYNIYIDAVKGTSVKEMGISLHNTPNFLDSKNHAGFVYIRPTFQCLEHVLTPKEPFLVGVLIHRWETPWAKLFPLRLILRLGAEYRYYPSPIISTRHRDSVFVEIGHTIINLLADFRNYTYTLPQIRGLIIHMEDKNTTIMIPKNRYNQVLKSINNSSDHILAFAGNFSPKADSHLVCIQDTQSNENAYTTHAINIHNKPRKVTGASFIVFNGALKSSSGLTAKSNIVEDGLMIQVLPEHMTQLRENLRSMKDHTISCGCVNATSDESVSIVWGENDVDFNLGIKSLVDGTALDGVPSIRVHNGKDYVCSNGNRLIRWTEVFIIQNSDENSKNQDPVDISKISESIAKASCNALVKYLDLLVSNSCSKIGIRVNLHVENVSYAAGSSGVKLPPIYMRSLDNELIPVLHRITSNNLGDSVIVLEFIFRILNS